jgi:putative DNA primase/helicase
LKTAELITAAKTADLNLRFGRTAKIDIEEAERFLAALAPGETEFAFSTHDDNPKANQKNRKLAHEQSGTFKSALPWLVKANKKYACVQVAINETDGHGRKKGNVVKVRALRADLDGEPLDKVRECELKPHIIVESSEGRYHVYYRVKDFPLDAYADVQRGLAARFDGDPDVASLERCGRIPGFFHCKGIDEGGAFQTRIVEINDHPPFTADEVMAAFPPLKKPHKAGGSRLILPKGAPVPAAEAFVARHHTSADGFHLLRHYRGAFYVWMGTHWAEHPPEVLRRDLYRFLNACMTEDGPYNPTKNKVGEVFAALEAGTLVRPEWETPCWLGGEDYKPVEGELVACRNGILNLETRELTPHTPRFFSTNCLPLDYDPQAPEPKRWMQFLEELWPEDPKKKGYDWVAEETLGEIAGYLLTSDTRQQKLFLIKGPKRGGKGTIVFVLEKLIGRDFVTYQTLNSMTGEFGRWPLIDKKLAVIADARLGTRNTGTVTETLLSISGGDPQTINRKYGTFWNGRLAVRFLITTNVLPELRDPSRTIASRFILLDLTESFYGKEDTELSDKLFPELPGILDWALDGLDRLRKRGHFRQPKSSQETLRLLEDLAAPVGAFVREWCEIGGPELFWSTKQLYRCYRAWADEAGHKAVANNTFGKELRDVVPKLGYRGAGATRKYVGIALSAEGQDAWDQHLADKGLRGKGHRDE